MDDIEMSVAPLDKKLIWNSPTTPPDFPGFYAVMFVEQKQNYIGNWYVMEWLTNRYWDGRAWFDVVCNTSSLTEPIKFIRREEAPWAYLSDVH